MRLYSTAVFAAFALLGCAVPATQVEVDTMSMRDALELTHSGPRFPNTERPAAPMSGAATGPNEAPRPLWSTPDIRMAYLYEWVDTEGNKHFGEWVAIPLSGFSWILNDGRGPPPTTRANPGSNNP